MTRIIIAEDNGSVKPKVMPPGNLTTSTPSGGDQTISRVGSPGVTPVQSVTPTNRNHKWVICVISCPESHAYIECHIPLES